MKKNRAGKIMILCALAIVLMIGCPLLTVTLATDAGMAICFLLFFAANPIFSAVCGIVAGKNIKRYWALLLLSPCLFLLGAWLSFDWGEPVFLLYCWVYFVIGMLAMLTRWLMRKLIKEGKES